MRLHMAAALVALAAHDKDALRPDGSSSNGDGDGKARKREPPLHARAAPPTRLCSARSHLR